jgi:hypothetical protein
MNISLIVLAALVCGQSLQPGPKVGIANNNAPIQAPPQAQMSVEQGRILQIAVQDKAYDSVNWIRTSTDYDLIPSESSKSAYFSAPKTGSYVVLCFSALTKDGKALPTEPTRVVIVVTEGGKLPEKPDDVLPGPDDKPAVDAFANELAAAFNTIEEINKTENRVKLAKAYNECAIAAEKFTGTADALYSELGKLMDGNLQRIALKPLREKVGEELNKILPRDGSQEVTADTAKKASSLFKRASKALSSTK